MRTKQEILNSMKANKQMLLMNALGATVFLVATFVILPISAYASIVLVLIGAFFMFRLLSSFTKQQGLNGEFKQLLFDEANVASTPTVAASDSTVPLKPKATKSTKNTPFGKAPFE